MSRCPVSSCCGFPLTDWPDIAQWAILAVRNLCEENPANQQLIAGLKAQGAHPVDESALRAAGGVVEVGPDGKVMVRHNTKT